MGDDLGRFLEACGASGPLRLQWDDREAGPPVRRDFQQPMVLVGRNPRADLVLDHPLVGRRHAYLQLVEGRLFAIDLESRQGLCWGGVPRPEGWVDGNRPVQVGGTKIRVFDGDRIGEGRPGPGPTSLRYEAHTPLPRAALEFRRRGDATRRVPLHRVLTLVGGSKRCHVRLSGPGISRFVCGLLRTPAGVWVVDLLSSRGVAINGVVRRAAPLEDGDVLRAGAVAVRLTYGGTDTPQRTDAPSQPARSVPVAGSDRPGVGPLPPALIAPPEALPSEAALRPLLEGGELGADLASSPFGQALIQLIGLLGEMHRDHLQLVREELEQIRRINLEMNAIRPGLGPPEPGTGAGAATVGDTAQPGDPAPTPSFAHPRPVDPEAIRSLVGERLMAWDQERRSRWQRVIELLVKS